MAKNDSHCPFCNAGVQSDIFKRGPVLTKVSAGRSQTTGLWQQLDLRFTESDGTGRQLSIIANHDPEWDSPYLDIEW